MKCHRFLFYLLFPALIFYGCKSSTNHVQVLKNNDFANGFSINRSDGYTRLEVYNPWEKAKSVRFDYYLVNRAKPVPDHLTGKKIIKTPLKSVICLSTSHLAFIDALGEDQTVSGISGSNYISNPEVRKRVADGLAVDVGYGQNLNYELILSQKPDLVMVYGIGSEVAGYVAKLEELGIPVIMIAEYLEDNPLGKAEWIKFFGELYEKGSVADSFYQAVKTGYLQIKELIGTPDKKPKVMVGSPYRDTWWAPGGNSYFAALIKDAGGQYLDLENTSHESFMISFEQAYALAEKADFWLNMASMKSKNEIVATDSRFAKFAVMKNGKLFNNNKKVGSQGGNDFWESGTVRPDWVLRDLATVFYPGKINGELVYYQEIK